MALVRRTSRSASGRRKSCAPARSAFAPSSSSPSTCTGRPTRSIASSASSLPKGSPTRRRSGSEIGKTRWEVPYLEPDAEAWRKHRETLDAHLPFRDFELARPTPDGGKRYVSVSGLPVFDKSGRFIGYRGVGRHITERKRAEEALRRSEAYLAEAQRLSQTAPWPSTRAGRSIGHRKATGSGDFDPLQGLPSAKLCCSGSIRMIARGAIRRPRRRCAEKRFRIRVQNRTSRWNGQIYRIDGHPLLSADGELIEMIATHVDITERKRAQEEHERLRQLESDLAHLNRLSIMGELTASLAHEILHPIATARNNARAAMRFLDMSPPNMAEVREALACIVRDADRGKDIVDRIRDHIKKAPPRDDRFDLNEAIDGGDRNGAGRNREKQGLGSHTSRPGRDFRLGRSCSAATGRPQSGPERGRSNGLGRGGGAYLTIRTENRPQTSSSQFTIRVPALIRNISSAFSNPSTRPRTADSEWACRSAGPSSTRMAALVGGGQSTAGNRFSLHSADAAHRLHEFSRSSPTEGSGGTLEMVVINGLVKVTNDSVLQRAACTTSSGYAVTRIVGIAYPPRPGVCGARVRSFRAC